MTDDVGAVPTEVFSKLRADGGITSHRQRRLISREAGVAHEGVVRHALDHRQVPVDEGVGMDENDGVTVTTYLVAHGGVSEVERVHDGSSWICSIWPNLWVRPRARRVLLRREAIPSSGTPSSRHGADRDVLVDMCPAVA
jgi:hypothetical protein